MSLYCSSVKSRVCDFIRFCRLLVNNRHQRRCSLSNLLNRCVLLNKNLGLHVSVFNPFILQVIFVGEEAVDAGGVRKEFFLLIMKELLDPKYGMFRYHEESRLIWFACKVYYETNACIKCALTKQN